MALAASTPGRNSSGPSRERHGIWPWLVAAILILAFWGYHLQYITQGGLVAYDEFLTLDRSSGFIRQDDWWTVYHTNHVTFRKPPLQYWMTAALMQAGVEHLVALRLPSMLFALGSLVTVAAFAALLLPTRPWAIPAAVVLLSSSPAFWTYANSAMLDAGATFFAMLALLTSFVAVRRPIWWYLVAVVIWIGSLQKAPLGLALVCLFVVVLVIVRLLDRGENGLGGEGDRRSVPWRSVVHATLALLLSVALFLLWPVLQSLLHGYSTVIETYRTEMLDRFNPANEPMALRSVFDLDRLILDGERLLRGPAILALAILPLSIRRVEVAPLPVIFFAYCLVIATTESGVNERYTLVFLPLLCLGLSVALFFWVRPLVLALAAVALISGVSGGPLRSEDDFRWRYSLGNPNGNDVPVHSIPEPEWMTERREVLSLAGRGLQDDETLVVCSWTRPVQFFPGAISYYASGGRPFVQLWEFDVLSRYLSEGRVPGKARGVCTQEQLSLIADRLVGFSPVSKRGGYVIWTADRIQ